jgi:inhibitor of KinA sporulation pathway (predicted exonuclease)
MTAGSGLNSFGWSIRRLQHGHREIVQAPSCAEDIAKPPPGLSVAVFLLSPFSDEHTLPSMRFDGLLKRTARRFNTATTQQVLISGMAKLLDKIVVVDIEATCWNGPNPEGAQNDIIEIGICLLDVATGEITDSKGIMVKPERSDISAFCTELTTITPEQIAAEGITFKDACKQLRSQYDTKSRAWASFGAYDQKLFQKQCTEMGVTYPFGASHINVKPLFALKHKLREESGMAGALDLLGLELEGTHHRGVDDAKNIAKILRTLIV